MLNNNSSAALLSYHFKSGSTTTRLLKSLNYNNDMVETPSTNGNMMTNKINDNTGELRANSVHIEMGDLDSFGINNHLIQEWGALIVPSYRESCCVNPSVEGVCQVGSHITVGVAPGATTRQNELCALEEQAPVQYKPYYDHDDLSHLKTLELDVKEIFINDHLIQEWGSLTSHHGNDDATREFVGADPCCGSVPDDMTRQYESCALMGPHRTACSDRHLLHLEKVEPDIEESVISSHVNMIENNTQTTLEPVPTTASQEINHHHNIATHQNHNDTLHEGTEEVCQVAFHYPVGGISGVMAPHLDGPCTSQKVIDGIDDVNEDENMMVENLKLAVKHHDDIAGLAEGYVTKSLASAEESIELCYPSEHHDIVLQLDSYIKNKLDQLERYWHEKSKLRYYGDPPLLSTVIEDYYWYDNEANPIIVIMKSIITFMENHRRTSSSKLTSQYECSEQHYNSSGSSGSSGSNADPCSKSIEFQNDMIDIHLSLQPEDEYNSTGNFEWGEDMKNPFPPFIPNKDACVESQVFSTISLHNYELNLLFKDFKQQEHYLMIDNQPPTWIGIN